LSAIVTFRTGFSLGRLRAIARNVSSISAVVADLSLLRGSALPADVTSFATVVA